VCGLEPEQTNLLLQALALAAARCAPLALARSPLPGQQTWQQPAELDWRTVDLTTVGSGKSGTKAGWGKVRTAVAAARMTSEWHGDVNSICKRLRLRFRGRHTLLAGFFASGLNGLTRAQTVQILFSTLMLESLVLCMLLDASSLGGGSGGGGGGVVVTIDLLRVVTAGLMAAAICVPGRFLFFYAWFVLLPRSKPTASHDLAQALGSSKALPVGHSGGAAPGGDGGGGGGVSSSMRSKLRVVTALREHDDHWASGVRTHEHAEPTDVDGLLSSPSPPPSPSSVAWAEASQSRELTQTRRPPLPRTSIVGDGRRGTVDARRRSSSHSLALCYAMLCYAMLCYGMLCYAMPACRSR
jgi:hypothetical protein